jgi:hypothetical protein
VLALILSKTSKHGEILAGSPDVCVVDYAGCEVPCRSLSSEEVGHVQFWRRPFGRAIIAALFSGILISHPAVADIIKMRNGIEHHGTIANREDVRRRPKAFEVISILVESVDAPTEVNLVRAPVVDIEFLVFEDGEDRTVIDLDNLLENSTRMQPTSTSPQRLDHHKPSAKAAGAVLVVLGGGMLIVGTAVKFGEETLVISQDTVEIKKTHNGLNYTLMIGGGIMIIAGVGAIASASRFQGLGGTVADGIPHLTFTRAF